MRDNCRCLEVIEWMINGSDLLSMFSLELFLDALLMSFASGTLALVSWIYPSLPINPSAHCFLLRLLDHSCCWLVGLEKVSKALVQSPSKPTSGSHVSRPWVCKLIACKLLCRLATPFFTPFLYFTLFSTTFAPPFSFSVQEIALFFHICKLVVPWSMLGQHRQQL